MNTMARFGKCLAGMAGMVLLSLTVGVCSADADTVTITQAGFTGYYGLADDGTFGGTFLSVGSGVSQVTPAVGTVGVAPLRSGVGMGSTTFTNSSYVEFYAGSEPHNRIGFTSACSSACTFTPGVAFLLGTFSLTNGSFFYDANAQFSFHITYEGNNDTFGGTLRDNLVYVSTINSANYTDQQRADFFYFHDNSGLGSMRVYEAGAAAGSNSGTINLYGNISSPFDFDKVRRPNGRRFL